MMMLPLICLLIIASMMLTTIVDAHVQTTPFSIGDEILLECRRDLAEFPHAFTTPLPSHVGEPADGESSSLSPPAPAAVSNDNDRFGPGMHCSDSNTDLTFKYGVDSFLYCGWMMTNEDTYNFASAVTSQTAAWQCRIPMSKDRKFYIPVTIPLWGIVEPTHMHINMHHSFVFHVDDGRIIGASIYSVRDQFQAVKVGSILNIHGPVTWFAKHSYASINGAQAAQSNAGGDDGMGIIGTMLACILCIVITSIGAVLVYILRLKPMLTKRLLKGD